jgi:hypothetical protein
MMVKAKKPTTTQALARELMAPAAADAEMKGWDLPSYEERARGTKEKALLRALACMRSDLVAVDFAHPSMRALHVSLQWSSAEPFEEDGPPMWAWRSILEAEGLSRGILPRKMTITGRDTNFEKEADQMPAFDVTIQRVYTEEAIVHVDAENAEEAVAIASALPGEGKKRFAVSIEREVTTTRTFRVEADDGAHAEELAMEQTAACLDEGFELTGRRTTECGADEIPGPKPVGLAEFKPLGEETKQVGGRRKEKERTSPEKGRTASEVTERAEMLEIWRARQSGLVYEEIERKFGLRPKKGMTAVRVIENYEKMRAAEGNPVKKKGEAKKKGGAKKKAGTTRRKKKEAADKPACHHYFARVLLDRDNEWTHYKDIARDAMAIDGCPLGASGGKTPLVTAGKRMRQFSVRGESTSWGSGNAIFRRSDDKKGFYKLVSVEAARELVKALED